MVEADWLLTDGVFWTGSPGGEPEPRPTAVAVRDGRIMALGSTRDLRAFEGSNTAVLSLEGRFVLPGFVDAHVHLMAGGLQLHRVQLRGVRTPEEFVQRVADRARVTPPGRWIVGGEWNHREWGGPLPSREWLDRATPHHPILLRRMDLHMGVVNSLALELCGIDAATPDPENGTIDRYPETGEPTGLVLERALNLVAGRIPEPGEEERLGAIGGACIEALARGVTQVHDMGGVQSLRESWASFHALRRLDAEGRLPIRVSAALPVEDWREVAGLIREQGRRGDRLDWGRVKGFVDGSLGSGTAWFHEPYLHPMAGRGTPISDLDRLADDLAGAVDAGLQPAVHAIGDRANDWLLERYRELSARHPERDLRVRVEHGQHLSADAAGRSPPLSVVHSVQPLHLVEDGRWILPMLGPERERRSFPLRSLEAIGGRLAFGSDWPVAAMDPLQAVWAAVTRRVPDGPEGEARAWTPDERLGLASALGAHTLGAAVAGMTDGSTGTLEPGKRADFAVLSRDPFQVEPAALPEEVQVDMTFVDGALLHRREDAVGTGGP